MPGLLRRRFLLATAGFGLAAAGIVSARSRRGQVRQVVERSSRALGTSVKVTALHEDPGHAEAAVRAAFEELELVEEVMSLYRPDSQVCRLNRERVLNCPHPHLLTVLHYATEMSEQSLGAFDVTVQPLWEVYAAAHKQQQWPLQEDIASARRCVDWRRVRVSADRIELTGEGTAVTLNGIAQGFAADRALAMLKEYGIEHALIDTGELAGLGRNVDYAWRVGIQHPREPDAYVALTRLENRCLATSGDYATSFSADHRYNHVFDPSTGQSPNGLASVSIAAPSAMQADALSTAAFVLGPQVSLGLLTDMPGVDAMFITKSGRTIRTAGFPIDSEEAGA